jgi:dipeptidyl aminopeptidase/acylaminoacyl peptidase
MQDDVADALLWARQQGLAGGAACIVGGSYGGYSTLMGLIRHPELYRCGSAWVPVTDPFLFLEGSWWVSDDISDHGRRYSLPQMVGDAVKDRDMLLENSPVAQAARITRPLQLVWGSEDRRVPIAHGHRLRQAMGRAGLTPEWIVYDGEAHGLRTTENQVDFARRLEAFLARHLRD